MTKIDVNDEAFLAEQDAIIDKVKIELYRKYKQKVVFQLSSLEIENIKSNDGTINQRTKPLTEEGAIFALGKKICIISLLVLILRSTKSM